MRRNKFSIKKKKKKRKKDLKTFAKNNLRIALNVLYTKKEQIYLAHGSKYNLNREKQVILLIILNRDKWHYLAVKKLLN